MGFMSERRRLARRDLPFLTDSISNASLTAYPNFDPNPDERKCTKTNMCGRGMLEMPASMNVHDP
jgi:hypothetical protein